METVEYRYLSRSCSEDHFFHVVDALSILEARLDGGIELALVESH